MEGTIVGKKPYNLCVGPPCGRPGRAFRGHPQLGGGGMELGKTRLGFRSQWGVKEFVRVERSLRARTFL